MTMLHALARRTIQHSKKVPIRRHLPLSDTSIPRCSHGLHFHQSSADREIISCSGTAQRFFGGKPGLNHRDRALPLVNYGITPLNLHSITSLALSSTSTFSSLDILPIITGSRYFSSEFAKKSINPSVATSNDSDEKKTSKNDEKVEKATTASSPGKSSPSPGTITKSSGAEKKDESFVKKATDATFWAIKSLVSMLAKTPGVLWFYITHPKDFRKKLTELKEAAVKEAHHYWMGSKLLAADVRTARHILGRTLRGSTLSRRERKQLLRTVTDVFRLVPMSVFVLVPFMEFALPFALKLFPNMLPSTFQDSLKEEEKMKRELQMRISMAGFFQDTLGELAREQKRFAQDRKRDGEDASDAECIETEKEASAASFLEFLKKARTGEAIPPDAIIKFSKYFEDNMTLDNMGRMQLINMCKYMGLAPYGNDNLLRFQLRHRIRLLRDDDQRILWEGIEALTKMELREACRERGMRSTGLSKEGYRKALQAWLELSVQKNVPISLLIMSRTFYLHDEMVSDDSAPDDGSKRVSGLADAMSGIDKEVLNEIVLEMASSEERQKNTDVMKIQLEVLEHQNELIKEEQEERDAAAKDKEKEKAKAEEEQNDESLSDGKESEVKDGAVSSKETQNSYENDGGSEKVSTTDAFVSKEDDSDEDGNAKLSTEEIEAISQLTSPDPVHREREELQRIKNAIRGESESKENMSHDAEEVSDEKLRQRAADASLEMISAISPSEPMRTDEAQEEALQSIKELEEAIEKEAKEVTVISMHGDTKAKVVVVESYDDENNAGDKKLQKAIDRLTSRVESMVGKIETQLTDVEVKIGNKFHLLDKDMDGVLTMEELAQVLQTVLKRALTSEEARAIAADMDQNKDGVVSIIELAEWAESNTIVKLAEDGREKDLDDMITQRVEDLKEMKRLKKEDEDGK